MGVQGPENRGFPPSSLPPTLLGAGLGDCAEVRGPAGLHVYPDGGSQAELPPNSWASGAAPNATSSWPELQNILGRASTLHGDRPQPSLPAAPVQTPTPRAAIPQPGRAGPKGRIASPQLHGSRQGTQASRGGEGCPLPGARSPDSSRILTLGMAAPTWGLPQPDLSSRQGGPSSNPWLRTLPSENGIRPRQMHFGGFPVFPPEAQWEASPGPGGHSQP